MNKLLYSFVALLLASGASFAQDHFKCATSERVQAIYAENPQLAKDYEQLFLNGMQKDDDTTVFVIPIVFHILHQYGTENISDAQILDQVDILNRDYRLLNDDTSDVIQQFKDDYGDIKIEFRLATIDPFGNCTNGIEHIYTHQANSADDYSKLNQWYRPHYLNVWVVNTIGDAGVAGYAYYPNATDNLSFWIDGIIILDNYVGSIGTSNAFNSRALTHEIGHWLGLSHTWGSTNDPMVACGDDNIEDTPMTRGFNYCPLNTDGGTGLPYPERAMTCNADTLIENFQNYMDYSYCSVMFTKNQATAMRSILQQSNGHRSTLITPETHEATGIDLTTPPTCVPIPDFNVNSRHACVGETVNFRDWSYNGPVTIREWTFQDGTPATSTDPNPAVSFNSFGLKTVTLTVGNASGTETKTFTQYMDITNPWADIVGPQSLDLNSNHIDWFRVDNPEENHAIFNRDDTHGKDGSRCFKLNNYKDISDALPFTDDFFYYSRLGGSVDAIITPSFDLRTTTGVQFSFDYSYATNATTTDDMSEQVRVYYSRNCGENWTPLGGTGNILQGGDLISGGFAAGTDYAPSNNQDWKTHSMNYPVNSSLDDKTRFKIEFTASDLSSNLYIDNIMVSGTLGVESDFANEHNLTIAPNPVISGTDLNIEYDAKSEPVTFTLRSIQGDEIVSITKNEMNQHVSFSLNIDNNLAAAYYFLEVKSASSTVVKKVAVIK